MTEAQTIAALQANIEELTAELDRLRQQLTSVRDYARELYNREAGDDETILLLAIHGGKLLTMTQEPRA